MYCGVNTQPFQNTQGVAALLSAAEMLQPRLPKIAGAFIHYASGIIQNFLAQSGSSGELDAAYAPLRHLASQTQCATPKELERFADSLVASADGIYSVDFYRIAYLAYTAISLQGNISSRIITKMTRAEQHLELDDMPAFGGQPGGPPQFNGGQPGGPPSFDPRTSYSGGPPQFTPNGGPPQFTPNSGPPQFTPNGGPPQFNGGQPGGPPQFTPNSGPPQFTPNSGPPQFTPNGGPPQFPGGAPPSFNGYPQFNPQQPPAYPQLDPIISGYPQLPPANGGAPQNYGQPSQYDPNQPRASSTLPPPYNATQNLEQNNHGTKKANPDITLSALTLSEMAKEALNAGQNDIALSLMIAAMKELEKDK